MLNRYLIENYHKLKDIAYNIAGERQKDDLFSFVIEELYKCDQERINEIIKKNQLTFYIVSVMLNQYHSKTSRYYYKYKKYYEYHVTTTIESITADNIEYIIKDKEISTILDYSLYIEYHLKMIKQYASEEEEFDELICEDVDEIKFLIKEIFQLALKIRNENEEKFK